ncbi:MAG: hypothetical protein K0Q55_3122 [Verrucomicrobia bacterium]|jgi:hypothetical protein|nr:hypothetical protein [Verrucomicrobiota bacterium]
MSQDMMKPSARYLLTFAAGFLSALLLCAFLNALHPAPSPSSSDPDGKGFLFDGIRHQEIPLNPAPPADLWK